ncbi:unnamed protein product [Brassicogethes aeneus]|uniref:Letm1 RBD domain-containing protein n=1 Tax=Brassicogethes aeneus TaxID=1431903 RepID=A0A9P0AR42_BRAAE|nr:unnamed protein product [Brassicogethes aeneus]
MNSSRIICACRMQIPKILAPASSSSPRFLQPLRNLQRGSIYKTEEAKKVKYFVVHKYIEYLKNYDKYMAKSIPVKIYRVFSEGLKLFISDLKDYFSVIQIIHSRRKPLSSLNRKELELYHQMPKDMRKLAPVLVIAALPIIPYVFFPLAYMFPKHFLTSHFWSLQERSKYSEDFLRKRLLHNKPVFRHLQSQINFMKVNCHPLFIPWTNILGMLGSGSHPSPEMILECKDLFQDEPYHLYYLSRNHIKHLVGIHDIHRGWFRRTRLADRATILIEMDKAIMREGGVHNLPIDALRNACLIRGLNPMNMKSEDMIKWLNSWIQISSEVDRESLSLLLHVPILLGYNQPTNWLLIYPPKQ